MRRQKRDVLELLALIVVLVMAIALAACVPQGPTDPGDVTIVNTNTNTNNQGSNGGTGGPGGGGTTGACNPIASAGVALLGTGGLRSAEIRVGQSITLDTTPRDSQNQVRPDSCNAATPVEWFMTPTAGICELNGENTYTPSLKGIAAGKCEARSRFGSVTAEIPVVVTVRQ